MPNESISLTPSVTTSVSPDESAIDLTSTVSTEQPSKLPDRIVDTRAAKYDFALGDKSPGVDELRNRIMMGLEESDRTRYALEKQVEQHDIKLGLIKQISDAASDSLRPLTAEEGQAILDLSSTDIQSLQQDPKTFFEKEFAKKVVSTMSSMGEDGPLQGAIVEIGDDKVNTSLDIMENQIAAREAYQKLAEEAETDLQGQSWIGWGADFAKGFVPGYTWLKMRNILSKESGSALLPGNNLAENIEAAYAGDIRETLPKVRQAYQDLAKDNQQLATIFAQSLVSYGSTDKLIDNILIPFADIATFVSPLAVAKGAGKAVTTAGKDLTKLAADSAVKQYSVMSKDLLKTLGRRGVTTTEALDALGQVPSVARTSAIQRLADQVRSGGASIASWDALAHSVPGFINVGEVLSGPRSSFSTGFLKSLEDELTTTRDGLLRDVFLDPLKADKYGPTAIEAAVDLAIRRFREERREVEHAIMNVFERPLEKGIGEHAVTIRIGTEGAEPFAGYKQAKFQADLLGFKDYQINPVGTGWSIDVQRPLDFAASDVRQAMIIDAKQAPTKVSNLIGMALTSVRTPEETVSKHILDKLKQALYGSTKLEQALADRAKAIGKVKNPKELLSFINAQRLIVDPNNPDKIGRFLNTVGDFEAAWFTKFGRLPEEQEARAYFAYKQLNDIDFFARNLGLYLDKNAEGLANHKIPGVPGYVEGKIVKLSSIEKGASGEDARIVVLQDGADPIAVNTKFNRRLDVNDPDSEKAMDLVRRLLDEEGYVLTQVSPTGRQQLAKMETETDVFRLPADFVVSKTSKAEPLSLAQLPYQEGGHHIMPDGYYISQAKLYLNKNQAKYYGDTTLMFAANEKIAKQVAANFEEARKLYNLLKKKEPGAADAFKTYVKGNLPTTPSQLMKDFSKRGRLDPDVPIMARSSGQSLDDAYKLDTIHPGAKYVRDKDSAYNLYRGRVNLQFTQERQSTIFEAINRGTTDKPLYGLRPASIIDAYEAMDQAIGSMIRGRNIEPLKTEVAERIMAEFGDLFETSTDDIAKDPFVALRLGHFKTNVQGDDLVRLSLAKQARARALQFFRVETQEQKIMNYVATKLLTGNSDAQASLRKTMSEILIEKDPASMVRGLAYQFHMGLFNISQMIKQGQGWAHVIGIAGPKVGTQAGLAASIQHFVMANPSALSKWGASVIKKLGYDEKEFLDMTEDLRRTGFGLLGREQATREQNMKPTIVQTSVGKFLDLGMTFTRYGEEFHRRAAWNAAYKEFLLKNKGRRPNDTEIRSQVLYRADLFANNMSHASAAAWNQGLTGIPTQFWSYQARLMEAYTGKRLTPKEKVRLFATYSTLYGVPVGVSSATLYPAHKEVKEAIISNNLDPNDDAITKVLNDGALSLFTEMLTGTDTNIEEVFGPAGIPFFKDVFVDQDKSVLEALSGPSGTIVGHTLFETYSGLKWLYQAVMPGEEALPVTAQDFQDIFGDVSSLSMVQRMAIGLSAHGYMTKRGEMIKEEENGARLLFLNALGIQPQDVADVYSYFRLDKQNRALQGELSQEIKKDVRAMLRSETKEERDKWMKRVQIRSKMLNDPASQINIISDVLKQDGTLITQSRYRRAKQGGETREFELKKIIEGQQD